MLKSWLIFLFVFSFFSFAEENILETKKTAEIKEGEKALKKLLEKYQSESFQLKIKQEVYLSLIKTNLISEGFLKVKAEKFILDLKGNPSSLTQFDGSFLWHQADKKEKIVFKLKNPMQFQILTNFFNSASFFKNFQIKDFKRKNKFMYYHLKPKQNIKDLKEIFIKAGDFILEIRLVWENLNSWQKYTLSKPSQEAFSDKIFQFPIGGFQVMDQF